MPKICDENKTRLSALAQLIQKYAEFENITKTSDLAKLTQYSERAIWKAKTELECSEKECTVNSSSVKSSAEPLHSSAQSGTRVQSEPRAHAYKESSTKINNTTNKQNTESEQVDSWHPFNGSTDLVVSVVCEWVHDVDLAKSWIRDALALSGNDAEMVKTAILTTKQKIAGGQMITSPPRFTDGIIQKLKGNKAQDKEIADKAKASNKLLLKAKPDFQLVQPYDPNDPNDTRGELPDDNETWI